jgi:uncharacterized damage-inducible protein DinB
MIMATNQFQQLATYNRWANARLYAAALELSSQAYRLPIGVFFVSLHGTLNHLQLTDRLDTILYEDRAELTRARIAEAAGCSC